MIAWTKFPRSESPTNILKFLEDVYQNEASHPDYNGSWDRIWKHMTRIIVDTYHYINHKVTDYLCRTYCNPSPGNGLAPNLVIIEYDNNRHPHADYSNEKPRVSTWKHFLYRNPVCTGGRCPETPNIEILYIKYLLV